MAGASTNRILVIGGSGSGKSTLAEAVVERYAMLSKFRYLVVLTKDGAEQSRLSGFCNAAEELSDEVVQAGVDWRRAIEAAGSLFLEVTALEPADALEALGVAILELGDVLLVVDEAQQIVDRNAPPGFLQVYSRGRKFGVNIITITQSLKIRANWGLNPVAINEATALVTFHKSDVNEVAQVARLFPELGDRVASLRTPRDGTPEWAVKDLITGRALLVTRQGEVDITAGTPAEGALDA